MFQITDRTYSFSLYIARTHEDSDLGWTLPGLIVTQVIILTIITITVMKIIKKIWHDVLVVIN